MDFYKTTLETVDLKKKSVLVAKEFGDEQAKPKKKDKKPLHYYAQEVNNSIFARGHIKVIDEYDGLSNDVTPKSIPNEMYSEQFMKYNLQFKVAVEDMQLYHSRSGNARSRTRSSMRGGLGGNKQSIDDVMNGITFENIIFDPQTVSDKSYESKIIPPYKKSFLKITLRKTEFFELHNQCSTTAIKGTQEGDLADYDNRQYDYLTVGKGKIRRRSDNDAQTSVTLTSSRAVNTIMVTHATVGSYVSNFEMYDTLNNMVQKYSIHSTLHGLSKTGNSYTQYDEDNPYEDDDSELREKERSQRYRLFESADFRNAVMFIGRTLSSNTNESGMRRFRNFEQIDRCSREAEYLYSMKLLFRFIPVPSHDERKAVSDMSFCRSNGDILAIGYGLYSFSSQQVPATGDVYVWSIKNPGEPERAFYYQMPVTAVCFSPYLPSLLAIGMYDGSVEVRDVSSPTDMPIAVSQRSTSPSCSPVVAIRWIKQAGEIDASDIDPFLSLSQDGCVTRFRINKSPFLLAFNQMVLERVEGHPEGIIVPISPILTCESSRHPQGLYITTHPLHKDIYYILTDEGCIHKCSINYQHQYLEVLKCHEGGVTVMEFSPWSPKLFLTCGNDWHIRIWIEGISRPLIELQDEYSPVHWANWSPTHATVLVSVNRNGASVWDIRRNILKPMAKHEMDSSYNTVAAFSNCGRTLVVGNERGNTLFQAMNDMPFAPHFQYDELEKAIYKAIGNDQEMYIELKSIGFFGYPNKKFLRPV
ncbi:uncharacterized protein Dwil_GK12695 [Drosophila willistoni]|uniref:Dynein axonemal intermediate chain 4 n=1 Tax=Drosophila willistoni TaxID=7260 RepID=B4MXC0_DROWI|nr:dynein axonemal intermediate chain 4 [Drosophila willistoni]EDW76953.1 uncharacterized protein Dwil_GK12695 [Drosophila willistoni]